MAINKKLINVSNGNQIYVTDLAQSAQNGVDVAALLPFKSYTAPVFIGDWEILFDQAQATFVTSGFGGVFLYNKFFGWDTSEGNEQVLKGDYMYGIAQPTTSEPRTSSTGIAYTQYVEYSILITSTARTDVTTDFRAQTGVFELINGATTGAMTNQQYANYLQGLLVSWRSSSLPVAGYDYVVYDNDTLANLNNNPYATNVLIKKGNYTISTPIVLNPATKRIVGESGAFIDATLTSGQSAFSYATLHRTPEYNISNIYVTSNQYGFTNCVNLSNCYVTITSTMTSTCYAFNNCNNLSKCYGVVTGLGSANVQAVAYNQCENLISCVGRTTGSGKTGSSTGFSNCTDISECQSVVDGTGQDSRTGFNSCDNINYSTAQVTCGSASGAGFFSCNRLSGCESTVGGLTVRGFTAEGFSSCTQLDNCTSVATGGLSPGWGFYECSQLSNCLGTGTGTNGVSAGYHTCTRLSLCRSIGSTNFGFNLCNILFGCVAQKGYNSCFMTTTGSNPVANTAAGGYNS